MPLVETQEFGSLGFKALGLSPYTSAKSTNIIMKEL